MNQQIVLVDKLDQQQGLMGKYEAHHNPGFLHRAISVVLYRKVQGKIELLLQQRSSTKPLWPLFWANTCCTHPLEYEGYKDCAVRRLHEEMGIIIQPDDLTVLYNFYYQADYDESWSEHELDTVILGNYDGPIIPNSEEVADYRWVDWSDLKLEIRSFKLELAPWFQMILMDVRFLNSIKELQ